MSSTAVLAALTLAAIPACVTADESPTEATSETAQAVSTAQLAPGQVRTFTFDGPVKTGIDPRFEKLTQKNVRDVSFKYGSSQHITMTATSAVDSGNIQLHVADFPATGGSYWKAWLHGTVIDSNNQAYGFCGSGPFPKGDFHTQVQIAFRGDGDGGGGICYCNLCPATDGHSTWCTTAQWQVGDPKPTLSGSGACRAPAGTKFVRVTLEAVAKGDAAVHRRGTAVFEKVTVGRCNADGSCPDAMTPNDYGQ